jgi:hypothetical protein
MDIHVLLDKETGAGYRTLYLWNINAKDFKDAVDIYKKNKDWYPDIVQFIDVNNGETIKGPLYDSTTQELNGQDVNNHLKKGIKQQKPIEPSEYQPRDRFQGNKTMNEVKKFRNIIRECISEIKKETMDPRIRLKESLRGIVKNVLTEMSSNVSKPEPTKEEKEKISKGYSKDGNDRLDKTNDKQLKELESIIKGINSDWEVYWDDHGQLIVKAQNLLYVRICQKFENNYDISAMVKLVDRVRAIALTWEQVKSFVKANFSDLEKKTKADQLTKKSLDNYDEKGVNQKSAGPDSSVKNRGEKKNGEDAKIKNTKTKDKDYNEPQVTKDEDMPDQPMKQVTEPGKDPESKNKKIEKTDKPKAPKFKNDNGLKVSDKKTTKFVKKQVSVK